MHRSFFALAAVLLLVSPVAQACELICVRTAAKYDGNLGGLAGADAKCAAEFPGFKFPRSASLVETFAMKQANTVFSYQTTSGTTSPYPSHDYVPQPWGTYAGSVNFSPGNEAYGWSGTQPGSSLNCVAWTNNGGTTGGAIVATASGGRSVRYDATAPCGYALPLVCCNM